MRAMRLVAVFFAALPGPMLSDELAVLESSGSGLLREYLRGRVHAALERRLAALEELDTVEEIRARQASLRARFLESLGSFPERSPLNSRVVAELRGGGYRVEKVIFESRPGFHVPAICYLPESAPPFPAVLVPCGHSENGKAAEAYQRASILLARNGLAALCYDPIGQGERKQILERDAGGRRTASAPYRSTSEHMLAGVAPVLLGKSLASYRIFDGMRAIDYLVSRGDIDAARIGCTGNSGGGLMTSYLLALDPRIVAAAPGCFITTTRRKNESPGPGDAEQNIHGQIAYGMDHADYLFMGAPRPVLICAATRDFVPIEGTWEAFRQAKRVYGRLGFPGRVDIVETDGTHGFSRPLRVAATRWMRRWLLGRDDAVDEPDFPIHSDEELRCTPRGQVLLLDGARSVFDLYREAARELRRGREERSGDAPQPRYREKIRALAGIRPLASLPLRRSTRRGTVVRAGYRVEKLVLESEGEIPLPALLFVPQAKPDRAVVHVHGDGKAAASGPAGPIEDLVRAGAIVLALDLRGCGETEMKPWRYGSMARYIGNNAAEYFVAYMLGRSLVGMRAEDIVTGARFLARRADAEVHMIAVGGAGVPALHAAACEPGLFASLRLEDVARSWERVFESEITAGELENTVHGALRVYDLPDLLRLYGGRTEIRDSKP